MSLKLATSPRKRKSAQALFLREKSLRSKNPSLTSVAAIISTDSRKMSEYARQLREKQKVRRIYGVNENQFSKYYKRATSSRENSAERMLQLLELRLDNAVYRAGFGITRAHSRQLVGHGQFLVNDKPVNIPSYSVSVGDVITVRRKPELFAEREFDMTPGWITVNKKKLQATIAQLPARADIDADINEQLIVEYYSR